MKQVTPFGFFSLLFAISIFVAPIAHAKAPDVSRIQSVYTTIKTSKDADTIEDAFAVMMKANAVEVAKRKGVYQKGQFGTARFDRFLEKKARVVRRDATISDRVEREEALYKQLINLSTQNAAHAIIDAWFDLPAAGSLVKPSATAKPASIGDQVTFSSTDFRLGILMPEAEKTATEKLMGGVTAVANLFGKKEEDKKAPVSLPTILEVGGPGTGNGIIDAGEWVQLSFTIQNRGTVPFFSSSGWLSEDHPCAWAPSSGEIVFPELPAARADAEESPSASISTWVYLSKTCANKTTVSLNVTVKDTHRAMRSPIILSAKLRVTNRSGGDKYKQIIDGDIPGYSDDGKKPPIRPDLRLELSHGLTSENDATNVQMNWAADKQGRSLLVEQSFRAEEPLYREGFGWRASDDVDIRVKAKKPLYKALNNIIEEKKWKTPEDARLWFGTDTEVLYGSPDGPEYLQVPIVKAKEICNNYQDDDGDGKADCLDEDCKKDKACEKPPACPSTRTVLELVKANAEIVASPTSPKLPGAISAVQPNYELVFKRGPFSEKYDCLLKGISLEKCGKPVCPDCKVAASEEAAPQEMQSKVQARHVRYVYRNYLGILIKLDKENCKDDIDNDLDGQIDDRDSDCAPEPRCGDGVVNRASESCDDGNRSSGDGCSRTCRIEKVEPPVEYPVIYDIGYSSRSQTQAEDVGNNLDEDVSGHGVKIQASYHHFTAGLVYHGHSVDGEITSSSMISSTEEMAGNAFALTFGGGYMMVFDQIQVYPRAQLGYFSRKLQAPINAEKLVHEGSGFGFGLGSVVRYKFTDLIGAYAEIDYWSDGATTERDGFDYTDGGSFQYGLGLSVFIK